MDRYMYHVPNGGACNGGAYAFSIGVGTGETPWLLLCDATLVPGNSIAFRGGNAAYFSENDFETDATGYLAWWGESMAGTFIHELGHLLGIGESIPL